MVKKLFLTLLKFFNVTVLVSTLIYMKIWYLGILFEDMVFNSFCDKIRKNSIL